MIIVCTEVNLQAVYCVFFVNKTLCFYTCYTSGIKKTVNDKKNVLLVVRINKNEK